MKRKIITIIFCALLSCTAIANFSTGFQVNVSDDEQQSELSDDFLFTVTPTDHNTYVSNVNSIVVVNITSPENGSSLLAPYLEVLGYAYSMDGLNYYESTCYRNNIPFCYHNSTLNISSYYGFRLQVFNLSIGTYKVVVNFSDITTHKGSDFVIAYYTGNQPPGNPQTPSGTMTGTIGVSYSYSTNATDPNNDTITYGWDWNGDGTVDQWTSLVSSGMILHTTHTFTATGTFNIRVMAEDEHGAQSMFSDALPVTITSHAPNTPDTPSGSSKGKPGVSYTYQTSTTDLDDEQLYYMWDWADGTPLTWDGPYNSGQIATASHIWSAEGSYSVKVKAKDVTGEESTWSDPLPIMMPYSFRPLHQILERLFQQLPRILFLLQQLTDS